MRWTSAASKQILIVSPPGGPGEEGRGAVVQQRGTSADWHPHAHRGVHLLPPADPLHAAEGVRTRCAEPTAAGEHLTATSTFSLNCGYPPVVAHNFSRDTTPGRRVTLVPSAVLHTLHCFRGIQGRHSRCYFMLTLFCHVCGMRPELKQTNCITTIEV